MNVSADGALLRRALKLEAAARRRTRCLRGVAVNSVVLLALAADLSYKCEGYTSVLHWVELCIAGVAGANLLQLVTALLTIPTTNSTNKDGSVQLQERSMLDSVSGASDSSDELSLSLSPRRQWLAPPAAPPPAPAAPPPPHAPRDRFIADRTSLADYLQQYEDRLVSSSAPAEGAGAGAGAGRTAAAPAYQLASSGGADTERPATEHCAPDAALWGRLHLDPLQLTQFNLNLRLWLYVTILSRVSRELRGAEAALARLGLPAVAALPAERLRALARAPHAPPSLPQLLPFLEPFAERRYVATRLRDLATPCLSEYTWNGGGADREESAPTDAELVLHVFAAYLDAQLPAAGAAPFSSHFLSSGTPPPRGPAIHRVSRRPPHYALALDGATLEVARGRNNLLHTILVFLAAAARAEPPALRRLHLGPAGLNMLWIIGR